MAKDKIGDILDKLIDMAIQGRAWKQAGADYITLSEPGRG